MDRCIENELEWITGSNMVSGTFSQKRFISKFKKLAAVNENVTILAENADGSIFVHFPLEMLKLGQKRTVQLSQQRKEELAERLAEARAKKEGDKVD